MLEKITEWLHDRKARKEFEEIFERKILGTMLIGYFVGDIAGMFLHSAFGRPIGDIVGLVLSFVFFAYWHRVANYVKDKEEEIKDKTS